MRRLALLLCLLATPALAQDYPSRPIALVAPFAAGGPVDIAARLVAEGLGSRLGQRVVVENQTGAGGSIGSARVSRAAPDGYTLLLAAAYLPAADAFIANLPFNPLTGFTPIGLLAYEPLLLLARGNLPAPPGAPAAAAWLRQAGVRASIGHAGPGTSAHQCVLVVQARLGVRVTEVAYRGTAIARQDLLAGNVDMLCEPVSGSVALLRGGQGRPVVTTGATRAAALPDVPTIAEACGPGPDLVQWYGLLAPPATPPAITGRINEALGALLDDAGFRARLATLGSEPFPPAQRSPAVMAAKMAADAKTIGDAARAFGVRPE